jgi:cyclase
LYKDYSLAKGWGFEQLKPAGNVLETIKVYTLREVDEIIFFNITAAAHPASIDATLVKDFSQDCFTPLTVGGGVRTLDDVGRLLDAGANKVSINTAAVETPDLIDRIAQKYGAGVCTVSIDYRRKNGAKPEVYTACGTRPIGLDPVTHARQCALRGANEILLTCIERDGTHIGYDLDVLRTVSDAIKIPVIASGGCGKYEHMAHALRQGRASAVAAGSIFLLTPQTPREAKKYLLEREFPVRP